MKLKFAILLLSVLCTLCYLELNAGASTWKKNRCALVVKKYNARAHVSSLVPLCISSKRGCGGVSHLFPAECNKSCGTSKAYYEPGYGNYVFHRTYCSVHWAGEPRPDFNNGCMEQMDSIPFPYPISESEFALNDYAIDAPNDYEITFSASGYLKVKQELNQFADLKFFVWVDEGDPDSEDTERDPQQDIWSYTIRLEENSFTGEELVESAAYYDFFESGGYTYLVIEGLEFTIEYDDNIDPEMLVVGASTDGGELDFASKITSSRTKLGQKEVGLKIFPNPTTDIINASYFNPNKKSITLKIINIDGKVIDQRVVNSFAGDFSTQFDVAKYSSGTYFISVEGDGATTTIQKFVKH